MADPTQILMPVIHLFAWGLLGGVLPEVAILYSKRQESTKHMASISYWLKTIPMILCGGSLVIMYHESGISLVPVLAVNIGASAPLVIKNLLSSAPQIDPGRINA